MAIKKQFVKSKPVCKVTFTVEAKEANNVSVIGDFNNWSAEGGALKKQKDGVFKGTFELAKDQMLYMFSDGYADQFGGEAGKKFKLKNLASLFF